MKHATCPFYDSSDEDIRKYSDYGGREPLLMPELAGHVSPLVLGIEQLSNLYLSTETYLFNLIALQVGAQNRSRPLFTLISTGSPANAIARASEVLMCIQILRRVLLHMSRRLCLNFATLS
jgi:hypothetical protein